jgi:hypothetical protein
MKDELLEPSSGSRNVDVDWAWLGMKGLLRQVGVFIYVHSLRELKGGKTIYFHRLNFFH